MFIKIITVLLLGRWGWDSSWWYVYVLKRSTKELYGVMKVFCILIYMVDARVYACTKIF